MKEYKDGIGKPMSKTEQIVIGAIEGTAAIHVAPLGIPFLYSKLGDKETSPLEKITATVTALVEGAAYYGMMSQGIFAPKILAEVNGITTLLIGGYLLLDSIMPGGLPDRMSNMINGGGYGGFSGNLITLRPRELVPQQMELSLPLSPQRNPNVYYL